MLTWFEWFEQRGGGVADQNCQNLTLLHKNENMIGVVVKVLRVRTGCVIFERKPHAICRAR
jgi:hypothetical protein